MRFKDGVSIVDSPSGSMVGKDDHLVLTGLDHEAELPGCPY